MNPSTPISFSSLAIALRGALVSSVLVSVTFLGMTLWVTSCSGDAEPVAMLDPVTVVDPLIGTGGGGFGQPQVFVGATEPFSMVRVGPDTAGDLPRDVVGFAHTSGYWYLDTYVEGFSHLHLSGTGAEDFGTFLVMPSFGMSDAKITEQGYRQGFRHRDEVVKPGLYQVTLEESGIEARLTASTHAAVHQYLFPSQNGDAPTLIFDVGHGIGRDGTLDGEVHVDLENGTVEGWLLSAGRFTGSDNAFPIYFAAVTSILPLSGGTWLDRERTDGALDVTGADIGAWMTFPDQTAPVEVRVGVSLISLEQAKDNRKEVEGKSFDEVEFRTQEKWRQQLGAVQMPPLSSDESDASASTTAQTIFYTALYHAALMPTRYSEANGSYVGLDRQVHDDGGIPYFSDLSMWDTYRTAHPLYALIWPSKAAAFATSILRMTKSIGHLPRWPLAVTATGTMLGSPASIIFADTWLRGARDFDVEAALKAMEDDSDSVPGATSRDGFEGCLELGFCSREQMGRPVAHAVEWGWADFATGQLLAARGSREAERFLERAKLYRGHLDVESGFLRGRNTDGRFEKAGDDAFDPTQMHADYAEGNVWHYLFSAPYDLQGLVEGLGRERTLAQAQELFTLAEQEPKHYVVGEIRAPDPYYWQSNEPDLHAAFVFSLLGEPAQTAKWVDWIRRTKYDETPWGIDGNDDGGTLSAWYALAALGLFPLSGSDVWILVPPIFDDISIPMGAGRLRVVTERSSPSAIYPAHVFLDGREIDRAWLHHDELRGVSELRFELVEAPTEWGTSQPFVSP